MFLIPATFPLAEYVGYRVENVDEGSHYVFIHLQPRGSVTGYIQFEGPVVLRLPNGEETRVANEQLVPGSAAFASLTGSQITKASRLSAASCRFEFSNGCALDLIGEKEGYESYHLSVGGQVCDV
jgi:hypothetical protein